MTEKFTFFYGGIASQWYLVDFILDGIVFNCCEQAMMARKATLFNDADALQIIMDSKDPRIQKAAGRTVRGFDKAIWEPEAKLIVYRANLAKYSQNPKEREWLMKSSGTTLVEASPWDTIWGIGLQANDPRAQDRVSWLGTNWLGEIETQVREDLTVILA